MKSVTRHLFKIFCLTTIFLCIFCSKSFADTLSPEYLNYKKTADIYCDKEDFSNAEFYYRKAIQLYPNEADFNKLGLIYYIENNLESSLKCFEVAAKLNPDNIRTKKKIEFIKFRIEKKKEAKKTNELMPKEEAPEEIHKLIGSKGELNDPDDLKKLHKIIDFIWSDKEGKLLLNEVKNIKINIKLTNKTASSYFGCEQAIPIYGYDNYSEQMKRMLVYSPALDKFIFISENQIKKFQNKDSDLYADMTAVMVVAHELVHMVKFMNFFPEKDDSKEEELIATLIGYNIASRTLTDKPLTEEQVQEYAVVAYNNILVKHYKDIPTNGDCAKKIALMGFELPHYHVYADIKSLKTDKIKNYDILKNYAKAFKEDLIKNYESVYTKKRLYTYNDFFVLKNKENYYITRRAYSKYSIIEENFNYNISSRMIPFPDEYYEILIPLKIYRNNKKFNIYFM